MRAVSVVCALVAVGLLAFAGYRYAIENRSTPAPTNEDVGSGTLQVLEPDRDMGSCQADERTPVTFRLANRSAQSIRVLGAAPCCGTNSCFWPRLVAPFDIPPGQEATIDAEVSVTDPKPFECRSYVNYYSKGGIRDLEIHVHGIGVSSPKGKSHVAKTSP